MLLSAYLYGNYRDIAVTLVIIIIIVYNYYCYFHKNQYHDQRFSYFVLLYFFVANIDLTFLTQSH